MTKILSEEEKKKLLEHLYSFISANKKQKIEKVLTQRTRHITVVLENIYQPHNASAVIRSCDCFGIQDLHIIENTNKYEVNPDVALGSSKWVDLIKYNKKGVNNTVDCINDLKSKGYKIVATTPHKDDVDLPDYPIDEKTALLFGTELDGLSSTAMDMADAYIKIPMVGFTESFNISVSAALCLYQMTLKLKQSKVNWELTSAERQDIMLEWARRIVKRSSAIEDEFLRKAKDQ